jgi:thiamine kinase-like enzyme/choline kinase/predicted transcriptional regulator
LHKFHILELILKHPNLSQKKIAQSCSISIGKVNYTINNLINEGLLETKKEGKKFQYTVTQQGKDFLKSQVDHFQDSKLLLHSETSQVKQAVILAAGQKSDFNVPVCLLEFEGRTLLERTFDILERNGIEKFIIVTGYMHEAFINNPLLDSRNVTLLKNDAYFRTGSMASLAMVREHVTDDFLLIEDDILIEENAVKRLLDHNERDSILVTKESGSGDEAYIEIKNNYLYKMSKDIHQLNRIDGEMIGVTKISYAVFNEMIGLYEINRNPYLNYEYLLLDVSRTIDIGFLKIPDLIWYEIDSLTHYNITKDKVFPMLKRKEASFKELKLKNSIADALSINISSITEIKPFGGMTNKNYKVTIDGKQYVVRVAGNGTEKMINRREEKLNSELTCEIGINPPQLYFSVETGMKIVEMIPESETLNPKTAKRQDNLTLAGRVMRKLHTSNIIMENQFNAFNTLDQYEALLKDTEGSFFEDYDFVREEVMKLKSYYDSLQFDLTACHNDPVAENFVKSGDDFIYLIDWEYGGMNDPLWDVAAFSLECEYSEMEEDMLLDVYYDGKVSPESKERLLLNKIFQDFLWSVWTLYKEAQGDDFGSYGTDRYNRAKQNIELFAILNKGAGLVEKN